MLHNIHDKARRLLEEGRFAEATQLLERIVAEEPSFTAARNNLTLAYFYQGRLEEAFRLVHTVLAEDPGNVTMTTPRSSQGVVGWQCIAAT